MADPLEADRAALNRVLSALSDLRIHIELVSEHLASLQRDTRLYDLHFDGHGGFRGISPKSGYTRLGESAFIPADDPDCVGPAADCEWLPKYIGQLRDAHAEAEAAISALPARLHEKLDWLTNSPWYARARLNCLDKIMKWPGDSEFQYSYASYKVAGRIDSLLEKAAKHDPHATWAEYAGLLMQCGHEAFAIRDAVILKPGEAGYQEPAKEENGAAETAADRSALGRKAQLALRIIEQEGPIAGKALAKRIEAEESTLRKHYIPPLKAFGVTNDGQGYYVARCMR